MVYSEYAIESLKDRLLSKSLKNATPKKYAGDMFEAYEVICQLQKENLQLHKKASPLSHIMRIDFVHQIGPYEQEEVGLFNIEHITEADAKEHIDAGRYCDDLLVIPKTQWEALFQNKDKECQGNEKS